MSAKHTPGPWSWHGDELLSDKHFVLACTRHTRPSRDDARLLAAARQTRVGGVCRGLLYPCPASATGHTGGMPVQVYKLRALARSVTRLYYARQSCGE